MRHAGLDRLRLCGAALVLLAHGAAFLYPLLPIYDLWLGIGWIGTEVFFGLSGFLVTTMLLRALPATPGHWNAFIGRRLWRVLPWFWAFIAINALLAWSLRGEIEPRLWAYPLLLQNSWAAHPAFFGEAWNLPPLLLFSVVAPLLALFASGSNDPRRALRTALIGLALGGLLLRAILVLAFDPSWDLGVRKWLPMRIDACAWGGVLACWAARSPAPRLQAQVASIGVLLLSVAVLAFAWLPLDASAFARIALFTLVGLGCALPLPWLCRGDATRALERAARATFPLYLVNMPLLHLGLAAGVPAIGALPAFVVWVLLSVAVAWWLTRRPRATVQASTTHSA